MARRRLPFRALWRELDGISSVEYALLLSLVAGGILAAASTLSNAVLEEFLAAAMCIDSFDPNCTF